MEVNFGRYEGGLQKSFLLDSGSTGVTSEIKMAEVSF